MPSLQKRIYDVMMEGGPVFVHGIFMSLYMDDVNVDDEVFENEFKAKLDDIIVDTFRLGWEEQKTRAMQAMDELIKQRDKEVTE